MVDVSFTLTLFQSAPLTEARGDGNLELLLSYYYMFQSAPLTEARGDVDGQGLGSWCSCFNPLPLPKQGEIWYSVKASFDRHKVSIRSPYRSKGRFLDPHVITIPLTVSIRSPYRSKGRLP